MRPFRPDPPPDPQPGRGPGRGPGGAVRAGALARRALRALLVLLAVASGAAPATAEGPAPNRVPWRRWEPATFAQARAEGRVLLVVVGTSWCHWCHVMQRETYADPRVERALAAGFLPVKEDGDARPDLAERLRDYRWPATAFFTPEGEPVLALRGYRSAEELLGVLADVRARVRRGGPYPGLRTPTAAARVERDPGREALAALRGRLVAQLDSTWDPVHAGWGRGQKLPLAEPIEWGLRRARTDPGESEPRRRALAALGAQEALLDRVWGGLFQYAVGPGWDRPHVEKLVDANAGALEAASLAVRLTGDPRWREQAALLAAWFARFHDAPDGTFFASQDAEVGGREALDYYAQPDAERRRRGIPRVDRSVYPRENGHAIRAHVAFAGAGGGAGALARAERAAQAVLSRFGTPEGLLRRPGAGAGCLLADQAEMGRALTALARETGEPRWREAAGRLAEALVRGLSAAGGGFLDVEPGPSTAGPLLPPSRSLEGNAAAARFLLATAVLVESPALRSAGLRAVAALDEPAFLESHWRYVGGLLLAVEEALARPRKLTVRTAPDDPVGRALLEAARAVAVRDPDLWVLRADPTGPGGAFAVLCGADGACSDPIRDLLSLRAALERR